MRKTARRMLSEAGTLQTSRIESVNLYDREASGVSKETMLESLCITGIPGEVTNRASRYK